MLSNFFLSSLKKISKLIFTVFLFLFAFNAYAQANISQQKENLRSQLSEVEKQISELEGKISNAKMEQKTLQRDISLLNNEIDKQNLEIKAINLSFRSVEEDILYKNKEITNLSVEFAQKKELLQESLKELNEYNQISWLELVLKGSSISDVFGQIQHINNLQKQVNTFVQNIDVIKNKLESEKTDLEDKKEDITSLEKLHSLQKESLAKKKNEKGELLNKTKGDEKKFFSMVKKSKNDVIAIKQQLFQLESIGVSMSFEDAYKYAKFAGEKTNIRPAFILGIFQVESKMGTYVGGGNWQRDLYQCYINLGKRARAEQEKSAFFEITSALGLNPDSMPVSKKPSYGCGGAMGAAQFLPTTWAAFKDQISGLTGHNPPSPWNIEDAFVGSSIKLSNNGANSKTETGERMAAAKYIAGARWQKSVAQRYASQVLGWANFYQDQIDAIESDL